MHFLFKINYIFVCQEYFFQAKDQVIFLELTFIICLVPIPLIKYNTQHHSLTVHSH